MRKKTQAEMNAIHFENNVVRTCICILRFGRPSPAAGEANELCIVFAGI